jgi:glycosyltransferase involved in cell wall biosynthesis
VSIIRTSVVIPVYYNRDSIRGVVQELSAAWAQAGYAPEALEFVLVDDASGDDSWNEIRRIRQEDPQRIKALRLVKNHGSQLAILAGASLAAGDYIAMVTADGQEPADLVARMTAAAEDDVFLVLAVRQSRADSLGTKTGATFFYRLMRYLGLENMPKEGFDAFLMGRSVMESILEMRDPNIPIAVTMAWLGYPAKLVFYDRLPRIHGKSRWTLRKKVKLALDAVTAVSYAPIRGISLFGGVLALFGFAYAGFAAVTRLVGNIPVQGWTSLLIAVLVIGGTQLLALGIIGEYLWRTLEVVRRRPLWRSGELLLPPDRTDQ